MSESVEQAALARAERDALPAPWPDILEAVEGISGNITDLYDLVKLIRQRHDEELAAIREGMVELGQQVASVRSLAIGLEDLNLYTDDSL